MRLLMIDDDEPLADVISQHLIQQHYAVDIATNGQMGLEFVELFNYDLIILDIMLPDLDGRTLCTNIRQNKHQMPILMLTSRDKAEDKVQGLDAGADDYIVKPIHLPELLARIRALLRRSSPVNTPHLEWGALQLDPNSFETTYNDQPVALTPKEYSILELFLRHPHKSQTLDGIIDNIWALESPPSLYAVRTHIKSVRHKLKQLGAPADFIETLYGFGYRLNPQYDQTPKPAAQPSADVKPAATSVTTQLTAMTQMLWAKHKDEIEARIVLLETLVQSAQNDALTEALIQQGGQVAHKLAGSLGCFSFREGSKVAKKIEQRLTQTSCLTKSEGRELKQLVQQLRASIDRSPQETPKSNRDRRNLLVYSDQPQQLQSLQDQTSKYGFTLTSVLDATTLLRQLKIKPPNVILIDLKNPKQSLSTLALLKKRAVDCPSIVILHEGEWLDRIDYIQYGVRRVFQAPVSASDILETAHQLESTFHARAKVMIVDDDCTLLSVLDQSLSTFGFDITTLDDTLHFWPMLKQTNPDVVVLDVEMPEVNGLELCQLLRSDATWSHLPVIFLTSHRDSQTEDHAFTAGADDFISKNLPVNRLALRIQNRLRV